MVDVTSGIVSSIGSLGNKIGGFFSDLVDSLGGFFSGLAETIGNLFSGLIDSVGGFFSGLMDFLCGLIQGIVDTLWSIVDSILNGILELLKLLFVPSSDYFNSFKTQFEEKFPIVGQVGDLLVSFKEYVTGENPPSFHITWDGVEYNIVDFSVFAQVRTFVFAIIIAIAYWRFGQWLLSYVPDLLRGL